MAEKKVDDLPPQTEQLLPRLSDDILALDEVWSFLGNKGNQAWLWTALCRRTRQIVGWVLGPRTDFTAVDLCKAIEPSYRTCRSVSDGLPSYEAVFPPSLHRSVGKETGETAHMERWNHTMRQRLGRLVRKTLSFSKSEKMHEVVIRLWVATYNLAILAAAS